MIRFNVFKRESNKVRYIKTETMDCDIDQLKMQRRSSSDREEVKMDIQQLNIDLEDSNNEMNERQKELFHFLHRSSSNESVLNKMLSFPSTEGRPLFWGTAPGIETKEPVRVFKNKRKERQRKKCDYNKNICGYITKKIIREFVGETYEDEVKQLCARYHSSYLQVRVYYQSKREHVTGPSHLPDLITPRPTDSAEIRAAKLTFRHFFIWFIRERYLRYLILDGKMDNKKAYIQYKNTYLFKFLTDSEQTQFEPPLKSKKSNERQKIQTLIDATIE